MAVPALRAVRRRFPEAEIAILARPYVAEVYRDQGISNQLIADDSQSEHTGILGRERLAAELRAMRFDVALLLQNAFDAAWLAWRAKIPERIGYARDGRGFLLTHPVRVPKSNEIPRHERFYYLELLRRAGWIDALLDEPLITLYVSEPNRRRAAAFLVASGARQDSLQQRGVVGLLDIRDQALLAAVQPDKVARQSACRFVVAAGEITFRPLELDDPRAGIRQARTAIGRGNSLFQR